MCLARMNEPRWKSQAGILRIVNHVADFACPFICPPDVRVFAARVFAAASISFSFYCSMQSVRPCTLNNGFSLVKSRQSEKAKYPNGTKHRPGIRSLWTGDDCNQALSLLRPVLTETLMASIVRGSCCWTGADSTLRGGTGALPVSDFETSNWGACLF